MKTKFLLIFFCIIIMLPALFVRVVDPFQGYQKSVFYPNKVLQQYKREQLPGIIKNYVDEDSVDTLIVGSSLALDFEFDETARVLGGKRGFSVAFPGATPREQADILTKALDGTDVKKVFWVIGPTWYRSPHTVKANDNIPDYFFTSNPLDDLNYLYRPKYLLLSLNGALQKMGFSRQDLQKYEKFGLPRLTYVHYKKYGMRTPFNEKRMERMNAAIQKSKRTKQLIATYQKDIAAVRSELSANQYNYTSENQLLPEFFEANSDVEFTLLVPPVSLMFYYTHELQRGPTIFRAEVLYDIAKDYPNVKLYGVNDSEIIGDIRYYRDPGHFGRSISRHIIKRIESGHLNISSKQDAQTFVEDLQSQALNFNADDPLAIPMSPKKIDFDGNFVGASNQ